MKHTIFALLLIAFAGNTFASGFIKLDAGTVSWTIKAKDNGLGNVSLSRTSRDIQAVNLGITEGQVLIFKFGFDPSSLGDLGSFQTKFATTDERSQEEVQELIKKKMEDEVSAVKLITSTKDKNVEFKNLSCQEKGFFKNKRLECSAVYASKITLEFK